MAVSTRARLRKFWFQVHLWLGVGLALALVPICVTGAYEVWHEEIDRLIHAPRYATTGAEPRPVDAYLTAAREAFGTRATANAVRMPQRPGDPVIVTGLIRQAPSTEPAPRRPPVLTAWLDPATARVLDVADTSKAFRQTIHRIHGSLLIPEVGRKVVGWLGWALFVSALSGLWLWWPRGAFAKGFQWRRTPSTLLNLHYLGGFWIALPLAVLALSGALISFPQTIRSALGAVAEVTSQAPRGGGGGRREPVVQPRLDAELAAGIALIATPEAQLRTVTLPIQGDEPSWKIDLIKGETPVSVEVIDATGQATVEPVKPLLAGDTALRWNRRIHDGSDMGVIWRIIITLAGLIPAGLAVTGVIVWARRQVGKARNRAVTA